MSRPDVPAPALPVQLTDFVGREAEVAEALRLLAGARLLTLTGAGGSGKTRLALEVGARATRDGERTLGWAELAGLAQPELVAQQVAEQLGVREQGNAPATEALIRRLRDQPTLLVLDNCEHVVDAAARLVEALLRSCPRLQVLATSREPLAIGGERAWLVPLLSLPPAGATPPPADAARFDAVRLFVERAQDVLPSFALTDANVGAVAEICRRLDGLPLAIELAAARVRVLGPEQLLERLHDGFRVLGRGGRTAIPRHQTLRATIDWSYALLAADEQQLLDRLSVFSGGFSLDAAEATCALDDDLGVLDVLARLVDRSLVVMREVGGGARYALLETVRQYAAERLRARGEDEVLRARHAAHFHELVAAAEPHLSTRERPPWLERVRQDLDNVRAALAWTRDADPARHLDLAGRLCWFWFGTGFWAEGRQWSEGSLALPVAAAPTLARARALFAAAVIATLQAQPLVARGWLDEAVALAREHGDGRLEAYALVYLSMALVQQGKAEGLAPGEQSLAWFRAHGDLYGQRLALLMIGTFHIARGELPVAIPLLEEAVAAARAFGRPRELGIALQMLGWALLQQGVLDRAAARFHEALRALREEPQELFLARAVEVIGLLGGRRGLGEEAVWLLAAGEAMRERIGAGMMQTDRQFFAPHVDAMREAMGATAFDEAWAAGRRLTRDQALDLALARSTAPAVVESEAAPAPVAATGPALTVRALGPLEVVCDGVRLEREAWGSARARELLLYLLVHPGGRTRAQVGLDFWPDASAAQVKNSFHVLLHRLRKAVGRADLVVNEDERYRINPALEVRFDAATFEREARAARRDAGRLEAAVALYDGDLLAGEAMGDWHLEHQDRLRTRLGEALSALADLRLAAGDLAGATAALERLVAGDELREDAERRLMICYARAGQRDRALGRLEQLVARLRRELGAAPERATVELGTRLRRAEPV